jgi:hypothetical protein
MDVLVNGTCRVLKMSTCDETRAGGVWWLGKDTTAYYLFYGGVLGLTWVHMRFLGPFSFPLLYTLLVLHCSIFESVLLKFISMKVIIALFIANYATIEEVRLCLRNQPPRGRGKINAGTNPFH